MIMIGDKAPEFRLKAQTGEWVSLDQFLGRKWVVLFFYPKDHTPGCTTEVCAFRDQFAVFQTQGSEVIGISSDNTESHQDFVQKHQLPFALLSDMDQQVRKAYGVPKTWGLLPGRVTFLIDPQGVVRHVFSSQFKPEAHVQTVLDLLKKNSTIQNEIPPPTLTLPRKGEGDFSLSETRTETGTPSGQALLRLVHVVKQYPQNEIPALNDIDLTIEAGQFVALMGPSGCGKSTLLNLIGGIDMPTSGDVILKDQVLNKLNDSQLTDVRRTRLGYIFQFFNLLTTLTVTENIALPLLLNEKDSSAQNEKRVAELMAQLGISHRASFYPSQLSGGEMQRVAIARALVHQPALILADEPTGNLDSENGQTVLQILQDLCQNQGQTIIMATHSEDAARYAHRVIQLYDGKMTHASAPTPVDTLYRS